MSFEKIHVALGDRSYPIYVGAGLLANIASLVPAKLKGQRIFILCDENTQNYAAQIKTALEKAAEVESVLTMALPPGESSKSMAYFEKVLGWMLDHNVTRQSVLFAVGGGVIGDLAGFAAATVLRGISFVQVPTTLLAMVDSSVGGKTAIDMPQGKNMVGAFHQPVSVIADTDVLKTLSPRHMRAGYAEAIKHAALADAGFFSWLEANGQAVLAQQPQALAVFIEKNCRIKADIVAADEKEAGRRALLNLGHTFGHALEVTCGYSEDLLHGEAVAIGMTMALILSARLGYATSGDADRVIGHIRASGLPVSLDHIRTDFPFKTDDLLRLMYADKKAETDRLVLILMRTIGDAFVAKDVTEADVVQVLNDFIGV